MTLRKHFAIVVFISTFATAHARYGQGTWGFGGVGAGVVMVKSSELSDINVGFQESAKTGYSIQLKGGLGWYVAPSFVLDVMAGFVHSDVSGDAPAVGQDAVAIQHRTGLFQLSPRFRFGDQGRWQVGPLYKLHFGTDTNYREIEGQDAGSEPMTHFAGLHLNYDMPSESEQTIYRFGLEAVTDISDKRSILMGSVLFEVGFNLWGGDVKPKKRESYDDRVRKKAPPVVEEDLPPMTEEELLPPVETAPTPVATPVSAADDPDAVLAQARGNAVVVRFPGDRFQFATGMSHIGSKATREYIRELGEFMARNDKIWEKMSIVGHTDRRGPKGRERAVNMELSEARARTVFNTMVAAGSNPAKMRYEGKAFDQPVAGAGDDEMGWKLNRRVELKYSGVRAPQKILQQINQLNAKYGYGSVKTKRK